MKKKKTDSFIYVIIFLLIYYILIGQSFAQVRKEVGKTNGWREIQYNFGTFEPPFFNWYMSSKQLILGGKGGKGIRLLDIESGNIQDITTDESHKYPSCSPDGRYIFFTDSTDRNYKNLYLFDFETKQISLIYSLDKPLPIQIVSEPLSPSGKCLIGPQNWKEKIVLPGGEIVKVVPMFGTVEIGKPPEYFTSQWSFDGSILFLHKLATQTVLILDVKTDKKKSISIKIKRSIWSKEIKPSPDNTKLYFNVFFGDEYKGGVVNLYVMDLDKTEVTPKLLIKNIHYFDVSSDGSIIFSKSQQGYHQLYISNKGNKMDLIKKFRSSSPIIPHISKDGRAIAFFQILGPDEKTITILVKDNM